MYQSINQSINQSVNQSGSSYCEVQKLKGLRNEYITVSISGRHICCTINSFKLIISLECYLPTSNLQGCSCKELLSKN